MFVPQFLGRVDFIVELQCLADECDVRFVEIALIVDRSTALQAFSERSRAPSTQSHVDAAELVERSGSLDAAADMYDAFSAMLDQRPTRVASTSRSVTSTAPSDGWNGRSSRNDGTRSVMLSDCDARHNLGGADFGSTL